MARVYGYVAVGWVARVYEYGVARVYGYGVARAYGYAEPALLVEVHRVPW